MISFTVRMEFGSADRSVVTELLRSLAPASRQEPGCVSYIAHLVEGQPSTVLIYEQYLDEAALDFHHSAPHFQQYATALYKLMRSRAIENLHAID